jgi:hypothetical protein
VSRKAKLTAYVLVFVLLISWLFLLFQREANPSSTRIQNATQGSTNEINATHEMSAPPLSFAVYYGQVNQSVIS